MQTSKSHYIFRQIVGGITARWGVKNKQILAMRYVWRLSRIQIIQIYRLDRFLLDTVPLFQGLVSNDADSQAFISII